ncbi:MAG: S8 family serine peptidase [Candidatus Eremiobacterota bacterium]
MQITTTLPHLSARSAPLPAQGQPAAPAPTDHVQLSGGSGLDLQAVLQATSREAASLERKLEDYVPGQVLVKLKAGMSAQAVQSFSSDYGAKVLHRFRIPAAAAKSFNGELVQLTLPEGMTTAQAVAAMGKDPRVTYAEPNFKVQASGRLPDDLTDQQWGLQNTGQNGGIAGVDIKAAQAWDITHGIRENGPVIAVIDTGVKYNHSDLRDNMWVNPGEVPGDGIDNDGNGVVDDVHGFNGITGSGDPMDDHNHGTHCAGVIGAKADNGGIVGVNWEAQIMALKFLGEGGGGTTADAIKCILYATEMGAKITSNSWGGSQFSQACMDAMAASPALHLCAAGNEGYDTDTRPSYPACYELDNIVSVAAHDNQDRLARFSNRGTKTVDLAAPGVDIYSTLKDGGHGNMSGTSMATPHVSGVAGLIASRYSQADTRSIKSRILSGVDPMPEQYARRLSTGGRLNAVKALEDDQIPPGAPADITAQATPTSVTLNWTATGDDGSQGRAVAYDLRFSRSPISSSGEVKPGEISFDDATPVKIDEPKAAGQKEAFTVSFTPSGQERKLYFALQVLDNVGNRSATAVRDVRVPATTVAFEDSMDVGSTWKAEGTWGQVDWPGRGQVWTDSPGGDYSGDANHSLTSVSISLKDWKEPVLHFEARVDTEQKYDKCHVEVLGRKFWGGHKWREVGKLEGIQDWKGYQIDLSDYEGQEIQLRFRMESDESRNRDGVYLDNAVITARQGDNSGSGGCLG